MNADEMAELTAPQTMDAQPPAQTTTGPDAASGTDATTGMDVAAAPDTSALRPRTRWAGIVWGLVLAALAWAGVWLASGTDRASDLAAWARDLTPAAAIGYGILAIGGLLLVTGVVGLLRRAQRALAARER